MQPRPPSRAAPLAGADVTSAMLGIDHLVRVGHDLEAMIAVYRSFGFTVTPRVED